MRCPQCHADNPDQAGACLQCGMALALTCLQCGTELPPQANFCFHCGGPVMAPAAEPDEDTVALLQRAVQRLQSSARKPCGCTASLVHKESGGRQGGA